MSQSQPKKRRANIVIDTEAIMMFPISVLDKPRSSRTMGIRGAIQNQPKKQVKKVIHVRWKARMGVVLKSNRLIRVALREEVLISTTYLDYVVNLIKLSIYLRKIT